MYSELVISSCSLSCDLCNAVSVVTGGPLPSDHEYELSEVRFHWGKENQRGSEHTVNFKAFPMEVSVTQPVLTVSSFSLVGSLTYSSFLMFEGHTKTSLLHTVHINNTYLFWGLY